MGSVRDFASEHRPQILLAAVAVLVAGAFAAASYAMGAAAQEAAESVDDPDTATVLDTGTIEGFGNLDFLTNTEQAAFVAALEEYLMEAGYGWPCEVTVYPAQDRSDNTAVIYLRTEDDEKYHLCTWNRKADEPFLFASVKGDIEGITSGYSYTDASDAIASAPQQEQAEEETPRASGTSGNQATADGGKETTGQEQTRGATVPATDSGTLQGYLPYAAAKVLPDSVTNYLAGKGISADGKQALVDIDSMSTTSVGVEFNLYIADRTLSCEWNESRGQFGMAII